MSSLSQEGEHKVWLLAFDRVGAKQEDLRNHRGLAQSADRRRAPLRVPGRHRAQAQLGFIALDLRKATIPRRRLSLPAH